MPSKTPKHILEKIYAAIQNQNKELSITGHNLEEDEKLTHFPSELLELKHLEVIDLDNHLITEIPLEVFNLPNLKILDLQRNPLKKIPDMPGLMLEYHQWKSFSQKLSIENIAGIGIGDTSPPSDFEAFYRSKLSEFPNLIYLEIISSNQISDISVLKDLKQLQTINLNNNQISKLPETLLQLKPRLTYSNIHALGRIDLYNNPLKCPPIEIVENGDSAVRNYFIAKKEGVEILQEVRMLIVGEGAAGKTSLAKQLIGETFNEEESQTHGINIWRWAVKLEETPKKRPLTVRMWDFGGQEIMHATHQFFLSKRSLYVLVVDSRRDEKTEYWLKHIESFGGNSPILIVINKHDQHPGFDLDRKALRKKYPGIVAFFNTSCATGHGIEALKETIKTELVKTPLFGTVWPSKWYGVKTHLDDLKQPYIDHSDYEKLCKKQGVEDKNIQDTLLNFLNDLGVVLYFREFALGGTPVLEPGWATRGVYKLINAKQLAFNMGEITLETAADILSKDDDSGPAYPREKYEFIIRLMRKFELCYDLPGERILVPDLLPVGEPDFDFDDENALRFVIDYDFFPLSIIPRFIVKMHRDISSQTVWRSGVLLEDKSSFNARALVRADNEDKKIYLYVNGKDRRGYLSILRYYLNEIHSGFEKLEYQERVPLPDNPKISIGYEDLLLRIEDGEKSFRPEGAKKKYDLLELYGTINAATTAEAYLAELKTILLKVEADIQSKEDLAEQVNKIIRLKPKFFGFEIDVNEAVERLAGWWQNRQ